MEMSANFVTQEVCGGMMLMLDKPATQDLSAAQTYMEETGAQVPSLTWNYCLLFRKEV